MRPLVAIAGAPNVGKSTLFNRLVGRRRAIVTDEPGVTRDRLYAEVEDVAVPFRLVDTGGLAPHDAAPLSRAIASQAAAALSESDLVLFVVDARAGESGADREVAAQLRRLGKPLILVANKIDTAKQESALADWYGLGLGPPLPLSAEHGRGVAELLERVEALLRDRGARAPDEVAQPELRLAIVGRPNVGKSSLVNRLLGQERAMVSEVPGTTRDAVDSLLVCGARRYRLIDTAGMRRKGRVQRGVERHAVGGARRNIAACDVAVLVLDATEPFAAQDAHIAGYILDSYKPLIVAINKWDLVAGRESAAKAWQERIRFRLRFAKQVPLVLCSAKSGQRVARLLEQADLLHEAAGRRVPTPALNRWLQEAAGPACRAPARGRSLRLYYVTQTGVHPPRFTLFCNEPARAHFSVRRHLENSLREHFGFDGAPLRLDWRPRRQGPAA